MVRPQPIDVRFTHLGGCRRENHLSPTCPSDGLQLSKVLTHCSRTIPELDEPIRVGKVYPCPHPHSA